MADVRYVPDHQGVAELLLSSGMSDAMVAAAQIGADYYRSAVVKRTGNLANSVRVTRVTIPAGRDHGPRAGAMIVATADYAAAYEWRYGRHALAQAASVIDGRTRWESSVFRGGAATGRATTRGARARTASRARARAAQQQRRRPSQG